MKRCNDEHLRGMEVGMYIRTKYRIFKLENISTTHSYYKYQCMGVMYPDGVHYVYDLKANDIVKYSYKITDILEVGDYVNGRKIYAKDDDHLLCVGGKNDDDAIFDCDIVDVVTREQFRYMRFNVSGRVLSPYLKGKLKVNGDKQYE